jgi:transposase-like protein
MSYNQPGQHFLLSAKARTLSLVRVMRMSDEAAFNTFKDIRWASTGGDPVCPRCGCVTIYNLNDNRRFKCAACRHKFSVTSGTIFASRKMAIRDILAAIAIFANGAKGHSALQLSRDLDCQYKTAFVLAHKLREAIAAEQTSIGEVAGSVEVDGAYFGGYIKPANRHEDRKDRRRKVYQTGKREVVVVMRERGGRTLPFVAPTEAAGVSVVASSVAKGSTVYADEAAHWDALEARFLAKRINHTVEYATAEANTNQAESFFSRIRRAEIGIHHHIAGPYLAAYSAEMAWREDNRRVSNGEQFIAMTGAALGHPVSRVWKGYWQRAAG